jgi:YesN/AraC family two-component response regulator
MLPKYAISQLLHFVGTKEKATHYTFTDFLNQFRINQSKKLLLQNKNVTEACYESGYQTSYFNKIFKKNHW